MSVLCLPDPHDMTAAPAAAAPLARALGLSLAATVVFDAAAQADTADPAAVEAALAAAAADLAALLPPGVSSAGLALRLYGEPPWAPPVRVAIRSGARLLAIDAREGPALMDLGRVVRTSPVPVLAIGPRWDPSATPSNLRVLALGDGSEEAAAVAPALESLLRRSSVPVELLAVSVPVLGERLEDRELELAAGLQRLARALEGVNVVHLRVERAEAFESIAAAAIRVARETGATHIALATHGRGRALRFLLGSVADALLRASPLPLILASPARDAA